MKGEYINIAGQTGTYSSNSYQYERYYGTPSVESVQSAQYLNIKNASVSAVGVDDTWYFRVSANYNIPKLKSDEEVKVGGVSIRASNSRTTYVVGDMFFQSRYSSLVAFYSGDTKSPNGASNYAWLGDDDTEFDVTMISTTGNYNTNHYGWNLPQGLTIKKQTNDTITFAAGPTFDKTQSYVLTPTSSSAPATNPIYINKLLPGETYYYVEPSKFVIPKEGGEYTATIKGYGSDTTNISSWRVEVTPYKRWYDSTMPVNLATTKYSATYPFNDYSSHYMQKYIKDSVMLDGDNTNRAYTFVPDYDNKLVFTGTSVETLHFDIPEADYETYYKFEIYVNEAEYTPTTNNPWQKYNWSWLFAQRNEDPIAEVSWTNAAGVYTTTRMFNKYPVNVIIDRDVVDTVCSEPTFTWTGTVFNSGKINTGNLTRTQDVWYFHIPFFVHFQSLSSLVGDTITKLIGNSERHQESFPLIPAPKVNNKSLLYGPSYTIDLPEGEVAYGDDPDSTLFDEYDISEYYNTEFDGKDHLMILNADCVYDSVTYVTPYNRLLERNETLEGAGTFKYRVDTKGELLISFQTNATGYYVDCDLNWFRDQNDPGVINIQFPANLSSGNITYKILIGEDGNDYTFTHTVNAGRFLDKERYFNRKFPFYALDMELPIMIDDYEIPIEDISCSTGITRYENNTIYTTVPTVYYERDVDTHTRGATVILQYLGNTYTEHSDVRCSYGALLPTPRPKWYYNWKDPGFDWMATYKVAPVYDTIPAGAGRYFICHFEVTDDKSVTMQRVTNFECPWITSWEIDNNNDYYITVEDNISESVREGYLSCTSHSHSWNTVGLIQRAPVYGIEPNHQYVSFPGGEFSTQVYCDINWDDAIFVDPPEWITEWHFDPVTQKLFYTVAPLLIDQERTTDITIHIRRGGNRMFTTTLTVTQKRAVDDYDIQPTSVGLGPDSGTFDINVISSSPIPEEYFTVETPEWVTGWELNGRIFTFTFEALEGEDQRTGHINLTVLGITKTVTVTQSNYEFELSEYSWITDYTAKSKVFGITKSEQITDDMIRITPLDWTTVTLFNDSLTVSIPRNDSWNRREGYIVIDIIKPGTDIVYLTRNLYIYQQKMFTDPIYDLRWYPIATDALYTTQTGSDYIEYTLTLTDYKDNVIGTYEGRAYSEPDGTVNVYVNDIVANYLTSVETFPFENNINIVDNYRIKATITTNFGDEQTFVFMNSWVREPSMIPSDSLQESTWWRSNLSAPIDDKFDTRQYLTFSWNEFVTGAYYKIGNGSPMPITSTIDPMTVFFAKITTDKPVTFGSANGGSFTYKPVCGDYALYYVNAYGGWDSLLVKAKQTDEIKSYDYSKTRDFEKDRYLNVITPTWNVTTYYGVNGNRMFHLLESTCVYLHNLETNEMTKVVIEDSKCEYKDRFANYTFKLNACLDNYRK